MNLGQSEILAPSDIDAVNQLLEKSHPTEAVKWAAAQFGDGLVMSSSFGADSAVLIHMAIQRKPGIRIIMVDTGYLFPETFAFMEQLRQRFNLNVWTYRTRQDPTEYLATHDEGDAKWRKDVDACCAANKNEPFDRAMKEQAPKAWLRGIRRGQADSRKDRQFVEWSSRYGCYAISPLLNWTSRDIHGYLKQHELPYHPLRDQGYVSIGCKPLSCTRPIMPGQDERSGRWSGTGKLECGINLNSLDSANL